MRKITINGVDGNFGKVVADNVLNWNLKVQNSGLCPLFRNKHWDDLYDRAGNAAQSTTKEAFIMDEVLNFGPEDTDCLLGNIQNWRALLEGDDYDVKYLGVLSKDR